MELTTARADAERLRGEVATLQAQVRRPAAARASLPACHTSQWWTSCVLLVPVWLCGGGVEVVRRIKCLCACWHEYSCLACSAAAPNSRAAQLLIRVSLAYAPNPALQRDAVEQLLDEERGTHIEAVSALLCWLGLADVHSMQQHGRLRVACTPLEAGYRRELVVVELEHY